MAKAKKVFKTYEELIELLKSRGIIIDNPECAINILSSENYYSVINGYNDLFLNTTRCSDCYKPGTNFSEIVALYNFDRHLREILLIELLRIEKLIRTKVTYTFSKYHGYDHRKYLSLQNFNSGGPKNQSLTQKLIDELNATIQYYSKKHKAISYYLNSHGYVPLWVLSNVVSFGTLNYFISRMLIDEKIEVSNEFGLNVSEFESILHILCDFRNKCAHGERIYSYKKDIVKSHYIPIFKLHSTLRIPSNEKGPKYGREDVLALLIVLKFFISTRHYPLLIAKIENQLNKLSSKLSVVSIQDVMQVMGLVPNWTDLKHFK